MGVDTETKYLTDIILLVTELYIAEHKTQDLLLNKDNPLVNREVKMYLSNIFSTSRKQLDILQSKYDFSLADIQNDFAQDIEDINKLFVVSSKEDRREVIEHLLEKVIEKHESRVNE